MFWSDSHWFIGVALVSVVSCAQPQERLVSEHSIAARPADSDSAEVQGTTVSTFYKAMEDRILSRAKPSQPEPSLDRPMGTFRMTYYWVAEETKGARTQRLVDKNCKLISRVSKGFKRRLTLEGTGKLRDGRVVTIAGSCKCGSPCFWVASEDFEWGAGVAQRPLSPFRSIAVDPRHVRIGTKLYVAELDGLRMPGTLPTGGFVHDGCVVADDRGGAVRGRQIDFFAALRGHYRDFVQEHKIHRVTVYRGGERCSDPSTWGPKSAPRLASNAP